ncbi:MAG: sensor histidine kinase [Sphingomonadales bacterium]
MDLYASKQRWKLLLVMLALFVVGASLFYSNQSIQKIGSRERTKAKQWALALRKKAELVELSSQIFGALQEKERQKMELVVQANRTLLSASDLGMSQDVDFALQIIEANKDIPFILLNEDGSVSQSRNLEKDTGQEAYQELGNSWIDAGRSYKIQVFEDMYMTLCYGFSKELLRLQAQTDSLIRSFNADLTDQKGLVPVLLYDPHSKQIEASNLSKSELAPAQIKATINEMAAAYKPIALTIKGKQKLLYLKDSEEVKQLYWLPYLQFGVLGLLVLVGYLLFSMYRKAEQNQVWAGMAKETAHQLGTPLSSMMAWVAHLEQQAIDPMIPKEMHKDLERLEKITDRFSKIGSGAKLIEGDLAATIENNLNYLKARLSQKVEMHFELEGVRPLMVLHNASLIEWVVENICKNAVDAMEGIGTLHIQIREVAEWVHIDISDTGKGLTPKQFKTIFEPGYSTKKRGWGLGLTLVKRIVEEYHKGKVFVLQSTPDKGTTFRISIPH